MRPTEASGFWRKEKIMNASHTVVISCDNDEANQFAAWLNTNGHTATVGNSTGNYIDGTWTSADGDADEIMQALWSAYCDAA